MTTPPDPLDAAPDYTTDERAQPGATVEQQAMLLYESVRASLHALQAHADHTAARNYVAFGFNGLRTPFDRAELHIMRPGGRTPTELVEHLKGKLEHVEGDRDRFIKANAEIAVLLAQRICDGDPIAVTTDEDAQRVYDGLKASNVVLLKANCKAAADGMLLLALVKDVRDALAVCDPAVSVDALAKIKDVLDTMGIAL